MYYVIYEQPLIDIQYWPRKLSSWSKSICSLIGIRWKSCKSFFGSVYQSSERLLDNSKESNIFHLKDFIRVRVTNTNFSSWATITGLEGGKKERHWKKKRRCFSSSFSAQFRPVLDQLFSANRIFLTCKRTTLLTRTTWFRLQRGRWRILILKGSSGKYMNASQMSSHI